MPKILIVGAGLSGLSTAYALRNSNVSVEMLEARPRSGGRILTKNLNSKHLELGATWFGPQHTSLLKLVRELDIPYKTQDNGREAIYDFRPKGNLERFQIPGQAGSSTYKFETGSSSLIEALKQQSSVPIHYNEVVKSVKFDQGFEIRTVDREFKADYLVMSIPPQLITDSIRFEPGLSEFSNALLSKTHTWMSDSIKFSVAFDSAFWKKDGFIGTLMSPQQIIQEMYDHSDVSKAQHALVGFLNSNYSKLKEAERKQRVLKQLATVFLSDDVQTQAYADINWREEKFTIHEKAVLLVPHQNNGNPGLREGFFNNRLFFSASETAAQTPGYMDGAVHRGLEVGEWLLKNLT
ncbi:FAD-dependent oxidoreductase [Psychroflexus sp. YR1-1]|uniref:FAD-dependent oxidoreductase n=1 Tax=Psychroflexus aurantiacus TaxID=2709310 RepID=A0A6B3R9E0_9FLAO|nr:FAD-dependent oxidoreductase [Psychroflexus aurantiacus]NEV94211.1 FAD-dependent oxidoreductase [Psychroflexus aurantiacus]